MAAAPVAMSASTVSVEDARVLAAEFFGQAGVDRLSKPDALQLVHTSGKVSQPLYYVFNAINGGGYVIISADDCVTPILGYSTDGSFSASALPPAMSWYLSGLENEIGNASRFQRPLTAAARRAVASAAARSDNRITLSTPQWRQEAPFNKFIPGQRLVGCVGTAMGIIMKYYEYPASGEGSYNGVDFEVAYDWSNMRNDAYRTSYTTAEADAVATLLYHTSASIGTQYGMSGSSAYEVRVPAAMSRYFGYDPGISYKKRSDAASQAEFDAIIENEIRASRPVIYCGQDVSDGHAFVVDGYDPATGMLHINWGWGGLDGNNNGGWYLSTALNPTVSQSHSFNNLATIIYNIQPGDGDNGRWSPIHITADAGQVGIGSDMTELAEGKNFTLRVGNLKNVSNDRFTGKVAVALFDANGQFKALLSGHQNLDLQPNLYLFNSYLTFYGCKLASAVSVADDDVVRLATSADGGVTWLPVPGELLTVNEIRAKRTSADCFSVTLPAASDVIVAGEGKVIRGWDYRFNVTPRDPVGQVVTVKANGYVVTPREGTYEYTVANVLRDLEISLLVQDASEVRVKRSVWVEKAGSLSSVLSEADAAIIKDLTIFGSIDATDFEFMKSSMTLTRLDISSAAIVANGANQANALPKNAFQNLRSLKEVVLPSSLNRINNGAFRSSGITSIVIPAGVKTYEYNVFLGCSYLKDIWVGRETAEFINWCVLSGTNKGAMTLHVPTQAAVNNYSAKENWKEIGNIIVDPVKPSTDCLFAVMDDPEVKFDCATLPGKIGKGTTVAFMAEHIAENDNRMAVYANNTLLTPGTDGKYACAVNSNTIIHFDIIKPQPVNQYPSDMQLTNTGGTVGLLTDAVNVFPGVPFTIRANAFKVPASMGSFFWAAVLTDKDGNIKEFISPVSTWNSSITGDGLKMNINCCVNEATVREGNLIRLATSWNNKTWSLVEGASEDVIDALPALNNQTPVYNITFPDLPNANVSGVVSTAVRGRDITIKVSPKSARDHINMAVNGEPYATEATSVEYSFIAKQDMVFDVEVVTPPVPDVKTYNVNSDVQYNNMAYLLLQDAEANLLPERVVITGIVDPSDLQDTFERDEIRGRVKSIDLSKCTIASSVYPDVNNSIYSHSFGSKSKVNTVLEEVILPSGVTSLLDKSLGYCTGLTEVTLPAGITGKVTTANGSTVYSIEGCAFEGSVNITTIYITSPVTIAASGLSSYPELVEISHFNPNHDPDDGYRSSYNKLFYNAGIESEVTVVVPKEDLHYYKMDFSKSDYYNKYSLRKHGNPWQVDGYNIVSENPVYTLDFDPARLKAAEGFDIDNINFLRKNVKVETISTAGKLFLADDAPAKVKVYDNGKLMSADAVGDDRSVNVVFHNPNTGNGLSGNHDVRVRYFYDVKFSLSSDWLSVVPEGLRNDGKETFETMSGADTQSPVVETVAEGSSVRFRVDLKQENADILPKVKVEDQVIAAGDDGYYTVDVDNADINVEIFAVPRDGATLNKEEIASVEAAEATDVTTISLVGDVDAATLKAVVDGFTSLKELDLSGMTTDMPEGAFNGADELRVVALPDIESIPANAFNGCKSLTTVAIPATVSKISANAFAGCSSLESLTFSGIEAIEDNAFNGCENLKVIYFNSEVASHGSAGRRASKSSSLVSESAFNGLNPNCLIVLGEGVEAPASAGNYIYTFIEKITDTDAEGNTITREGRVYRSNGDIALTVDNPFESPYDFSLAAGYNISLTLPVAEGGNDGGWSSLVAPFETVIPEGYEAAVMKDGILTKTTSVDAYTPALIRQTGDGMAKDVTLTADSDNAKVVATPSVIEVEGMDYSLAATTKGAEVDTATSYLISNDGSAFELMAEHQGAFFAVADGNDDGAAVNAAGMVSPFTVYAVSDSGQSTLPIYADDPVPSAVELPAADAASPIKVTYTADGLVIDASADMVVRVYTSDGRLHDTLSLKAGVNGPFGFASGSVYIVGDVKVAF